jgi:hypothetical protein
MYKKLIFCCLSVLPMVAYAADDEENEIEKKVLAFSEVQEENNEDEIILV